MGCESPGRTSDVGRLTSDASGLTSDVGRRTLNLNFSVFHMHPESLMVIRGKDLVARKNRQTSDVRRPTPVLSRQTSDVRRPTTTQQPRQLTRHLYCQTRSTP